MRQLNIKEAEESDIVFHDDVPVGWRFGSNRFWPVFGLVAYLLVFFVLMYGSRPRVPTPFVTALIDLLDPKSSWVIPYVVESGWVSFILSALFILALTILLHQVFYGTVNSEVREQYQRSQPTGEEVNQRRKENPQATERELNAPVKTTTRFYRTFRPQPLWRIPKPPFFKQSPVNGLLWHLSYFLFALMVISNIWLFTYFFKLINGATLADLPTSFSAVYPTAILSRLFCLFISASTLLQYFYHDFSVRIGRFLRDYIRYFYPAMVSIAVIAFVFAKMGQFDAFFIELVLDPGQLALFAALLFPVSIAVIWFGPSYSYFTDQRFAHRRDSYATMHVLLSGSRGMLRSIFAPFGWLIFHVRLFLRGDRVFKQLELPKYFLPLNVNKVPPPSVSFTMLRDLLGIFYIFTLISICHNIYYGNALVASWRVTVPPVVALIGVLIYWVAAKTAFRNSESARNRAQRIVNPPASTLPRWIRPAYKLRDRSVYKPLGRKFFYVRQQWSFWLGAIAFLLFLVLFILTLYHSSTGSEWSITFGYFLAFLYVSLFFFAWMTLFQPFYSRYTFDKSLLLTDAEKLPPNHPVLQEEERRSGAAEAPKYAPYVSVAPYALAPETWKDPPVPGRHPIATRGLSKWDLVMDSIGHFSIQAILVLIALAVVMFVIYFTVNLFLNESLSSPFVQSINPLNVYLLLINGFIASIFFVGRFAVVLEQTKIFRFHSGAKVPRKYNAISSKHFFQGLVVVAGILAYSYYGNRYHEVPYRAAAPGENRIGLAEYTGKFLERLAHGTDTTGAAIRAPVILVAADGGGLKACYWTMLHLYRLDSMGLFDDNVFLMSGASGGNIGLSMYTLLKARYHGQPRDSSFVAMRRAINEIGETNFLSGDFTGLITRFPVNFLPDLPGWNASELEDRAEAMARSYYRITGTPSGQLSYAINRTRPYSAIWEKTDYDLPLFISNTTRAEDGMRGFIHPLRNLDLAPGMVDLTYNNGRALSFPDASFLANRFPIMSPAGRIEGKGHFVDAGNSDNSGISTIMHFLRYMKAGTGKEGDAALVYQKFFDHPLVLIGIRNDPTRFVRDQFYDEREALNRNFRSSEIGANSNAAINSGLTGVANSWDDHLKAEAPRGRSIIDNYYPIDLPFRLHVNDVHRALSGELDLAALPDRLEAINAQINTTLGCAPAAKCFAVAPPLGRLLAKPSLAYMLAMVDHPDNVLVYDSLRNYQARIAPGVVRRKRSGKANTMLEQ